MADMTVADIMVAVSTVALVLVTGWYARLTKRIADAAAETAQSSERSAQTGVKAAEAAARSAEAAEDALLAESMPFVRPSFDQSTGRIKGDMRTFYTVFVRNSGRYAALNVEVFLGEYRLHTFPVVEAGSSVQYKPGDDAMTALMATPRSSSGWVLRTRYSDPYGHRYEVVEEHVAPGGVTPEHRVSTYRIRRDGTREPLLGGESLAG